MLVWKQGEIELTQYQPDDKSRIRRQKSDAAIRLAAAGKWEEAVQVNKELLAVFPDDSETLNRLGKAYLELKRFDEAKEAYEQAVRNDPSNSIAQKNLQRLAQAIAAAGGRSTSPKAASTATPAIAPSAFIEETGKTGVTNLIGLAPASILAKLTPSDPVTLELDGKNNFLLVKNEEGEVLGHVEPKLALRLIRFIESGNRYMAWVTSVGDKQLKIIIREAYQDPTQRGKLSFPPKTGSAGYRAYIKDTAVTRYGFEDEEEGSDDAAADDDDDDGDEEEGEVNEDFNEESEQDEI